MGKITFITGGARSGKSTFAESLLSDKTDVLYIATAIGFDEEMKERIAMHRARRNPDWETVEVYRDFKDSLADRLRGKGFILFDCITIMISNLMILDSGVDWDNADAETIDAIEQKIRNEVGSFISLARGFRGESFVVSNELGMGLVPSYPLGRHFRDIAGRVNLMLASEADAVFFLVSGIPLKIK